jgi:hypothetical protein
MRTDFLSWLRLTNTPLIYLSMQAIHFNKHLWPIPSFHVIMFATLFYLKRLAVNFFSRAIPIYFLPRDAWNHVWSATLHLPLPIYCSTPLHILMFPPLLFSQNPTHLMAQCYQGASLQLMLLVLSVLPWSGVCFIMMSLFGPARCAQDHSRIHRFILCWFVIARMVEQPDIYPKVQRKWLL